MPAYVAMLRGVNVGGNPLKMAWLREQCEEIGLLEARTYLQSGNIVFSANASMAKLIGLLKERIDAATRRPVPIVLRSAAEMRAVVSANPFLKQSGIDLEKLHVTFLGAVPAKPDSARLDKLAGDRDRYHLLRREMYLYCPINYGDSKLSNTAIEKALAVTATTRNWKTVLALLGMAGE